MVVFSYSIFARKDKIPREYEFLSILYLPGNSSQLEDKSCFAFGELDESGFY
jgi:hypothetical protein